MSITVVPGPTLNLNVTDATSTVDLTVQTTPSFTLEFQAGQGPAGIGLPAGGFTDQVLAKNSNTSGDVSWKYVSPASVGLGNVDNTSDMDKPVSTAQQTAIDGAKSYADGLVVGLWDDRGSFDASVNTYPASGGSGPAGAIKKGDVWTISVLATSGPLLDYPLGTAVRALVDAPTSSDWAVTSSGLVGTVSVANGGTGATSLTGLVKGNGTSPFTAAAVRTDYAEPTIALATGILKNTTGTGAHSIAVAGTDYVGVGAITSSGLTMATARLLGRTTPSTGATEEITVGSGLSLSAGTLSASASATLTISDKTAAYTVVTGDNGTVIRTTSGTGDIQLLSAATAGLGFNFTYVNATTATRKINKTGTDTFGGGGTSYAVAPGTSVQVAVVDASASGNWQVLQMSAVGSGGDSFVYGYTTTPPLGAVVINTDTLSAGTPGQYAVAIGAAALASGDRSTAVGLGATASASYSTAIGKNSANQSSQAVTGAGAMALGGSYASGTDSFAAAIGDNTSSYGAKGNNSVAIGYLANATGTTSLSLGGRAASSASNSIAICGGSVAANASGASAICIGGNSTASGTNSIALGVGANALQNGKVAIAHGNGSSNQYGLMQLRCTTTGSAVVMTADGNAASTTNQLIAASNQVMVFTGTLIGKQTGSANIAAYEIKGTLVNNAGTVTMPTGTLTLIGTDSITLTTSPTLAADNTNKGLTLTSGAKTATNIKWQCFLQTAELTYA